MEDRIFKIGTTMILVVFAGICAAMYFMPNLHQRIAQEWERRAQIERQKEAEKTMDALELLEYNTEAAKKEEESFSEQLRIAIPENSKKSDLKIANDYLKKSFSLVLPEKDEEFIYMNPIIGSSNHVKDLHLWTDGEGLHIELDLDQILEPKVRISNHFLYVDFLNPHKVYEKIVVIDPGHGGNKPGTVNGNICEKDINLKIIKKIKSIFDKQKKIGVYFTRLDDSNVGLEERVRMANSLKADLFLSIHQNALGDGTTSYVNGTQVLYDEKKGKQGATSMQWAKICSEEVIKELKSKNMGLVEGHEIYIIRESRAPVALIEIGFMTNPDELKKLNSKDYQEKAAKAIYNGIIRGFKEGF
ncbi:MAG: N-acetylmuramoyl-L-alanine amidase [Lachnospiraceae bacterium]